MSTNYPTKTIKDVEVLVVPFGVGWVSCNLCPFDVNNKCTLAEDDDYCGFGSYYVSSEKFAIARLQGKV